MTLFLFFVSLASLMGRRFFVLNGLFSDLLEWHIKLTKDLQIGYWINFISFAYSLS